jgi:hypothetical protein
MLRRPTWLSIFLWCGCGCGDEVQTPTDTYVAPAVATASPSPLFEGLQRIAVDFSGTDFTGVAAPPTIEATAGTAPRAGDLEITEWLCNNVRCGVLLRVGKWLPPPSDNLPYPIDGQQLRFRFQGAANEIAGTVLMLPLHRGGSSSVTSPPFLQGTWMFASFELGPGVPLTVQPDAAGLPGRLFVTGDVRLGAGSSLDASGLPGTLVPSAGGLGGPGGGDGAAAGDALRSTGGAAGSGTGGGGGGGFGEAGAAGDGHPEPTTGGGAGGAAGQAVELDCLRANGPECGGGGGGAGGGGAGGGGGGGGAVLVSLGTLQATDAVARSNGGAGADGADGGGGGGGGGGALAVAAVQWDGNLALETLGGAGGAAGTAGGAGGAGGDGRVRFEAAQESAPAVTAASNWRGPAVDLEALDLLTRDAETELRGRGEPGATIRVRNHVLRPAGLSEAVVEADGTFVVRVPLQPGLNDFEVWQRTGSVEVRSLTGTMFELTGRAVLGARIYIVRVPEVE